MNSFLLCSIYFSKMDGVCCNTAKDMCIPYTDPNTASNIVCSIETDCRKNITCNVNTFECPVGDKTFNSPDNTLCNEGT